MGQIAKDQMEASLSNKVGEKAETAASKLEDIKKNKGTDVHEKAQQSADKLRTKLLDWKDELQDTAKQMKDKVEGDRGSDNHGPQVKSVSKIKHIEDIKSYRDVKGPAAAKKLSDVKKK
ncbi:hypothetical protein [Terribacillus sp. JSM ZJ617]|uniref:hypothetical protein n=1 Tax=Terribacillus sp. JSM ZJ617 TaxID=3342119 RepID=UPI0035A839F6